MFPPAFILLVILAVFLFWCESSNKFFEIGQRVLNFIKNLKE